MNTIGQMIPLALVTGLSPFGLIALFLVIDTPRPVANGVAFLIGWAVALTIAMIVVGVLLGGQVSTASDPGLVLILLEGVLGLAALVLGARLFRPATKPTSDDSSAMNRLHGLSPWGALVAGGLVPTYPPAIVAGTLLVRSDATTSARVWGLVTFIVIATAIPAIPVILIACSPQARATVDRGRESLIANRRRVGAVMLFAAGVYLLIHFIVDLAGR